MSVLAGKRVVVTRARAQAAALCDRLAGLGACPIVLPTIEIAPLDDYDALDRAIRDLSQYQWVVFTSVNGVEFFWQRLALAGEGRLPRLQIAAIGPATARALEERGVRPALVPDEYVAEALAAAIGDAAGQRVLLPRAELAREALADELGRRGAIVHEVPAYQTLPAALDLRGLAELRRGVDAVTFTSSSTVRNFVALVSGQDSYVDAAAIRRLGPDGVPMPSLGAAIIACIGPVTAQTAREAGLPVDAVAATYTMDGLVTALVEYFARSGGASKENRWILKRLR